MNKNNLLIFSSLILILCVYFTTCSRTVPPYRDSGELIIDAATLSVAHSPGYPTYVILGKVFISIGSLIGMEPAFSMNFFSSLSGIFAVLFVMLLIKTFSDDWLLIIFSGFMTAFAQMNWYLANVAEMYSLNLMFIAMLLYLIRSKKYYLFSLIGGLMLGNHLSSVFALLPMILFVISKRELSYRKVIYCILIMMLGGSVYLFLPVRAAGHPFINWGDPSTLSGLIKVVTRAAYGHTLDLVSREVTLAQVFVPQLIRFAKSLIISLTPVTVLLAIAGLYAGYKERAKNSDFSFMVLLVLVLMMTGPLFLYIARMPMNQHALAIVEVSYMVPELVLVLLGTLGIAALMRHIKSVGYKNIIRGLSICLVLFTGYSNHSKTDLSSNRIAHEYATNILNSLEKDSILIMRRDHTMFSLWYEKDIMGLRTDIKVISKGLLSAPWYRDKLKKDHPDIFWKDNFVSDDEYIAWLYSNYAGKYPFYMTAYAAGELSDSFYKNNKLIPYGLVMRAVPRHFPSDIDRSMNLMEKQYKYMGEYISSRYYDFFSRDIISVYSRGYDSIGTEYLKTGEYDKAEEMYDKSILFSPEYHKPYSNLAYIYFREKDYENSIVLYKKSLMLLEKTISQHTRKTFFYKEYADIATNLGVVYEKRLKKTKNDEDFQNALHYYNTAIKYKPNYSQAYFNMGAVYWTKGEWKKVVESFELALKYNPNNPQIMKYLKTARKNLKR